MSASARRRRPRKGADGGDGSVTGAREARGLRYTTRVGRRPTSEQREQGVGAVAEADYDVADAPVRAPRVDH